MYNLRSSLCTTCGVHYVQPAEFIMYNMYYIRGRHSGEEFVCIEPGVPAT